LINITFAKLLINLVWIKIRFKIKLSFMKLQASIKEICDQFNKSEDANNVIQM